MASTLAQREQWKAARQRRQEKLDAIKLERGCKRCGYRGHARALEWHHRQHTAGGHRRRPGRNRGELLRCDVLCANCHRIEHA